MSLIDENVKPSAPMPSSPASRVRARAPHRAPDRRMTLTIRFGQDVVRRVELEVFALERVVLLLPHAHDLGEHFVVLALGRRWVVDVERRDFVAARAPARAELEATVAEVVEHRDLLGRAHRMIHARRQVEDARTDVDAFGGCREIAGDGLVRRQVCSTPASAWCSDSHTYFQLCLSPRP